MTIKSKSKEGNLFYVGNTKYVDVIMSTLEPENNIMTKIDKEFNKNLFSVDYILEKQHKVKSYDQNTCTSIYGQRFNLKTPITSRIISPSSNIITEDFRHGARKFIRDANNVFKARPRKPEYIFIAYEALMLARICAEQYSLKGKNENLILSDSNFDRKAEILFEDIKTTNIRINKVIAKEHAKMNLQKGYGLLKKSRYQDAADAFIMAKDYAQIAREYGSGKGIILDGGNRMEKSFGAQWKSLYAKASKGLKDAEKIAGYSLQTTLRKRNVKIQDKEFVTYVNWNQKELPDIPKLSGVGYRFYTGERHTRLFQNLPVHICDSIVKEKQRNMKLLFI